MSVDKFGPYITKLMTVVVDNEQEQFVRDLAIDELNRLNVNVKEFLDKHLKDDSDAREKTEKKLLQEDKNVKDK
jgi:hypothetical protein